MPHEFGCHMNLGCCVDNRNDWWVGCQRATKDVELLAVYELWGNDTCTDFFVDLSAALRDEISGCCSRLSSLTL